MNDVCAVSLETLSLILFPLRMSGILAVPGRLAKHSAPGGSNGCHVDDKAVLHIALLHALERQLDILHFDHFDV
ncbi:hypothetical protein D3C80_1953660 [compost metagenome]